MTYLLLMIAGWLLPLSDLGSREYTIREATARRAAAWGWLAEPALAHEVAHPHSAESSARAVRLLDRLPELPEVFARLIAAQGARDVPDEALAHLAPQVLRRLRTAELVPPEMDDDWLRTGGMCELVASPDGSVYYRAYAIRFALTTAFNTRILRWYGFWSPAMWG